MKNKKLVSSILVILLLFFKDRNIYAENELQITAKSAIAIDFNSGRVLYEYNPKIKMPMASTTKIMTAILAIENSNLEDYIAVGVNPMFVGGSSIGLKPGEKIRMEDLLYGLMLESGNDAAIVIAEHIAGSVGNFVKLMNEKAFEIGAYDTHFVNPHGLDIGIDNHYTTAYDLSLIAQYALKNQKFKNIVSTKYKTIPSGNNSFGRQLKNHNKLLWLYNGVYGVKTGYTKKAGRCLVTASERNGFSVIVVTLNCPDDWNDTINLLNYIYDNYQLKKVINKNTVLKNIKVSNGIPNMIGLASKQDLILPIKKNEYVKTTILSPNYVEAPVEENEVLGELLIEFNNGNLRFPLVTKQFSKKENFVEKINSLLYNLKLKYQLTW